MSVSSSLFLNYFYFLTVVYEEFTLKLFVLRFYLFQTCSPVVDMPQLTTCTCGPRCSTQVRHKMICFVFFSFIFVFCVKIYHLLVCVAPIHSSMFSLSSRSISLLIIFSPPLSLPLFVPYSVPSSSSDILRCTSTHNVMLSFLLVPCCLLSCFPDSSLPNLLHFPSSVHLSSILLYSFFILFLHSPFLLLSSKPSHSQTASTPSWSPRAAALTRRWPAACASTFTPPVIPAIPPRLTASSAAGT